MALIFGVNMQIDDTQNLFDFFRHVKATGAHVDTFELGNELGDDYITRFGTNISKEINAIWATDNHGGSDVAAAAASGRGGGTSKPGLVGPSNAGDSTSMPYLQTTFGTLVSEQDYLAGITFHAYPFHNGGGPTLPDDLLNLEKIEGGSDGKGGLQCFKNMMSVVRNASSATYKPEVWMGEGNAAGHGGRPGITNTLENSFWYAHALGTAADLGLSRFLRQDFIGGGYELVNRTTFEPNPDYYVALLWQRLMGTRALNVTLGTPGSNVRVHVMCARVGSSSSYNGAGGTNGNYTAVAGDVVVVAINFDQTATITVALATVTGNVSRRGLASRLGSPHVHRYSYAIRATDPPSAPQGRTADVSLKANSGSWTPLKLQHDADGTAVRLPSMPSVADIGNPLNVLVQPLSYSFNLMAGANAAACL